jgi:hypothetical protein
MDLTDIYRILYARATEYAFFSVVQNKTGHIVVH